MPSRNTSTRKIPSTPPAPGSLPVTTYAVLGQLAGGPSSGYEVKARLEAGADRHASDRAFTPSRAGWLGLGSPARACSPGRAPRRTAQSAPPPLPAGGRSRAWLREPWGLASLKDESLVKLTLAEPLEPAEVADQLRRLKAEHERRRAEFEAEIAGLPEGASPYLVIALRKGVHAQRAFARWCQESIDELEGGAGGV